jgi:hypothetical protein
MTRFAEFVRFVALTLGFALAHGAAATTYYVRASAGSDANTGLSPLVAFRTLTRAMTAAQPGDVIYVGGGTYLESVTTVRAGTSAARIRFIGDTAGVYTGDPGTPVVRASGNVGLTFNHAYIDLQWFTIDGGVTNVVANATGSALRGSTLIGASDDAARATGGTLALTGCTIEQHGGDAVEVLGQAQATLTSCTIRDGAAGINVSASGARATISRCTVRDLTGLGALSTGTLSITNTVFFTTAGGVRVTGGAATLWNNTLHAAAPIGIDLRGGTLTLRNTIVSESGTGFSLTGGTATHANNLYHANTTNYAGVSPASTDRTGDPRFIDPASDWRLGTGSPAINAASVVSTVAGSSSAPSTDLQGVRRPSGSAVDLGAFETPTLAATVPYTATFESATTAGAEWNLSTVRTSTTLTRFAGRHANSALTLSLATTPGETYTLVFDAYMFDTWDGDNTQWGPDYFGVHADGVPIMRTTFARPSGNGSAWGSGWGWPDMPERWTANLDGGSNIDAIFRRVVIDFKAERGSTCLSFVGENLQGGNDESWGIDNVRIMPRSASETLRPAYAERGRIWGFSRVVSGGEGAGLFVHDFNRDGYTDLVVGGGAMSTRLMGTPGFYESSPVENIRRQAGLGDHDADGRADLWAISPNTTARLYRGSTTGTLDPWNALFPSIVNPEAVAAADLDGNGLLDAAYFAASGNLALLASADPSGSINWTESTSTFPGGVSNAGNGDFCASGDFNNDGYPDFFYHYAGGRLFLSNADGTYRATSAGISVVTGESAKMGSAAADFDNDGDLDLVVTRRTGQGVSLWVNPGAIAIDAQTNALFSNEAAARGLNPAVGTVGPCWGDFDNDGDLDLFMTATSGQAMLYVNSGAPNFTFTADPLQGVSLDTRGGDCVFFDADWDGWLDLAFSSENASFPTRLLMHEPSPAGTTPRSLHVRVAGRGPGGINTLGVGARVELWNANNTSLLQRRDLGAAKGYGGQEALVAHFGGVDPDSLYHVRVTSGRRTFTTRVVPSQTSTTIGSRTIPRFLTAEEPVPIRVVRWGPVSADE